MVIELSELGLFGCRVPPVVGDRLGSQAAILLGGNDRNRVPRRDQLPGDYELKVPTGLVQEESDKVARLLFPWKL